MKLSEFYFPDKRSIRERDYSYSDKPLDDGRTTGCFDTRRQLEDFVLFNVFCNHAEDENIWDHRRSVADMCNISWSTVYRIESNNKNKYVMWLDSLTEKPVRPSAQWRQLVDGTER